MLQMFFLREFYDAKGKVSTKNSWVWVVHAINYPYIIYVYLQSEIYGKYIDGSEARRMWIPLDIILTILIVFYQIFYRYMEILEGEAHDEHDHDEGEECDDYQLQNGKQSLGPIELFSMNNNQDSEI